MQIRAVTHGGQQKVAIPLKVEGNKTRVIVIERVQAKKIVLSHFLVLSQHLHTHVTIKNSLVILKPETCGIYNGSGELCLIQEWSGEYPHGWDIRCYNSNFYARQKFGKKFYPETFRSIQLAGGGWEVTKEIETGQWDPGRHDVREWRRLRPAPTHEFARIDNWNRNDYSAHYKITPVSEILNNLAVDEIFR